MGISNRKDTWAGTYCATPEILRMQQVGGVNARVDHLLGRGRRIRPRLWLAETARQ